MGKRKNRGSWCVLVLSMMLLAGCAGSTENDTRTDQAKTQDAPGSHVPEAEILPDGQVFVADWGGTVWKETYLPGSCQYVGGTLYYESHDYEEESRLVTGSCIWRQRGEQEPELICELGEEQILFLLADSNGTVYCLLSDQDRESPAIHLAKYGENGSAEYDTIVVIPDTTGERQKDYLEGVQDIMDGAVTEGGELCLCDSEGNLYLFDEGGSMVSVLDAEVSGGASASDFGVADAGAMGIFWYYSKEEENDVVQFGRLDLDAGKLGGMEKVAVEEGFPVIYDGYDTGILLADSEGLKQYVPGQEKLVSLLNWDNQRVELVGSEILRLSVLEGGEFSCLFRDEIRGAIRQVDLVKREAASLREIQTVTVGVTVSNSGSYEEDWYRRAGAEFHRAYPDYRLEVKTYATDGVDFETDLLKGEGPDLLELDYMDADMLTAKGVLEDLTPYFETSVRVGKEDLLASVWESGIKSEKMTRIATGISIQGIVARAGSTHQGGWTPEEYLALAGSGERLLWNSSAGELFRLVMNANLASYVDWEKRECHFTEEEFVNALEEIRQAGRENTLEYPVYPALPFREGDVLTAEVSIGAIDDYRELADAFGEDAEFAGYPDVEGVPRYQMVLSESFGMNSASAQKEGAWAFLELLLSEDVQRSFRISGFPVREDVFEEKLQEYTYYTVPGGINRYDGMLKEDTGNGSAQEQRPAEQEKDAVRYAVEHASVFGGNREQVVRIAREEADYFFQGSKSAREVAEIIQNRVMLLLEE